MEGGNCNIPCTLSTSVLDVLWIPGPPFTSPDIDGLCASANTTPCRDFSGLSPLNDYSCYFEGTLIGDKSLPFSQINISIPK